MSYQLILLLFEINWVFGSWGLLFPVDRDSLLSDRIPAPLAETGEIGPSLFGGFFHQERGVAVRTFFIDRFVPNSVSAFWKPVAAIEYFSPFGLLLDQLAITIFFRAIYTRFPTRFHRVDRVGIFTFGISATGQKFSVSALLNDHGLAAFIT